MPEETAIAKTDRQDVEPTNRSPDESGVEKMVSETKALSEDVAEWVRLKLQLIQIDIQERVTDEINALLTSVLVLSILIVALLLALIALSMYVGELLDDIPLGYAVVAAAVAILGIIVGRWQPTWIGSAMYRLVPRRWARTNTTDADEKPSAS